ncbi:hypothetical protein FF38_08040 [Lucilia cuprina]|uniref:Uncharacterized protein n=1 Tax=Lucilia cuprina TaxID=7375 RepID=A0A0L0BUF1_LUCCU|nr:hypothetical protein FF38_08040 [Lucilia cuprina]
MINLESMWHLRHYTIFKLQQHFTKTLIFPHEINTGNKLFNLQEHLQELATFAKWAQHPRFHEQTHDQPHIYELSYYLVGLGDFILSLNVGTIISQQVVVIVFQENVSNILEFIGIAGTEETTSDLINTLLNLRIAVVVIVGIVALSLKSFNFIDGHTENEDVFIAHLFGHFNISTIQSTNGQGTVQHEFHVTSTGSFSTSSGDLFGQISSGHDFLGQGDAVVFKEDYLEFITNNGIVVDYVTNGTDQFNDLFGNIVTRSSLATDHNGTWGELSGGILLNAIVQSDDVQAVQQLTFVLVNTLDLDVKHRGRVDLHTIILLQNLSQLQFVFLLNAGNVALEVGVLSPLLQSNQLIQMYGPFVANLFADQIRQARVAEQQPTTRSNTVGLVLELVGLHLVEQTEKIILQDLGVNSGYTVDGMGTNNGQMSHVNAFLTIFFNQRHAAHTIHVTGIEFLNIFHVQEVNVIDNLQVTRQNGLEHGNGPAFQSFGKDGVVGVGTGADGDIPSLLPGQVLFIDQDAHKFRNGQ